MSNNVGIIASDKPDKNRQKNQKKRAGKRKETITITKKHSLKSQFNHAISGAYKQASKKGDRENPEIDHTKNLYSIRRTEALRGLADSFCKYMKENHPEIKWVKDVSRVHVQEYIKSRENQWSERTALEKISQFKKLEIIVNDRFNCRSTFSRDLEVSPKKISTRDKAMEKADFEKVREEASKSTSPARDGLELGYRFGLRACEVVGLQGKQIDLEKNVLHLTETKGGKHRDVPIRERDREFARDLKERAGDGLCVPLKQDSFQRQLKRYIERAGLSDKYQNTTEHAIRKLYVRERMEELRGTEKADPRIDHNERNAWEIVQQEIGHGEKFRSALYNTYVR